MWSGFTKQLPIKNRLDEKYLVEGDGGGVEVMLTGAPVCEGGDASMMSSESTVDREAGRQTSRVKVKEERIQAEEVPVYLRWSQSWAPQCQPSPAGNRHISSVHQHTEKNLNVQSKMILTPIKGTNF